MNVFQAMSGAYRMTTRFPDLFTLFEAYIVCRRLPVNNAEKRLKNMGWIK